MILESAIGIRELIGLRIGLAMGIYSDRSDLLLSQRSVICIGTYICNGINYVQTGRDGDEIIMELELTK